MVKALFNREIIRGIFLLVLTILGTTVENTCSCQTLQFIYRNKTLKFRMTLIINNRILDNPLFCVFKFYNNFVCPFRIVFP